MTLSVSCPSCGKQFQNIKPQMAGKKARCGCGAIVRLGPKESGDQLLGDQLLGDQLLGDQLLGDQLLGDQLLGGDLTDAQITEPPRPGTVKPPHLETVVPEVPVTVASTKSKPKARRQPPTKPVEKKPLFDQTYGDLDDILAGVGDASPIVVSPQPEYPLPPDRAASQPDAAHQKKSSTAGFLAALGSATLAFWFGIFVAVSRFQIVDWFLLSGFSQHLYSAYWATFGEAVIPRSFQILFVSLGWLLWGVAVALVIVGVAQFINTFVRLLVGHQPVSWADGLASTLGVCAVFLMVGLVFSQSSFSNQQAGLLDEYEMPFAVEGERLENVSRLRDEITAQNRSFTTSMLVGAAVPMSIFVLSMVRLFAKASEKD